MQLYNRNINHGETTGSAVRDFYEGNDYYSERVRWLKRLSETPGLEWIKSSPIVGVNELCDPSLVTIGRNLRYLYICDPRFKIDIREWARVYLQAKNGRNSDADARQFDLTTEFILEEIACNIRIRLEMQLTDELYPGDFPEALPNLYKRNIYSATPEDLAVLDPSTREFRFISASTVEDVEHALGDSDGEA